MSVEFQNEQFGQPNRQPQGPKEKGITGWMMKTGIVKNKKQAVYVQIGLIVVLGIIMFLAIRSM